ncbi:MAG: 30S ribosomal protein S9 [bacterium]|nr:30S ribosomal protein S9 [bacterium]
MSPEAIVYAVGRRKTAVARVRLIMGKSPIVVNNKPANEYFRHPLFVETLNRPFVLTETQEKYTATVRVKGSGSSGQLGATVHGIARALASASPEYRKTLKAAGLLTRDPRAKESRKYGLAGKARKKKQSPKR